MFSPRSAISSLPAAFDEEDPYFEAAEGAAAETEHQALGWNVDGACAGWGVPKDDRLWDQTDVIGVSFAEDGSLKSAMCAQLAWWRES